MLPPDISNIRSNYPVKLFNGFYRLIIEYVKISASINKKYEAISDIKYIILTRKKQEKIFSISL